MSKPIAIIAIHGWQGDALSMQPLSKSIGEKYITWFFPQGPYDAEDSGYSWYGGSHETGWEFDLSFTRLEATISKAMESFSSDNIFILGFSQGAVFTFHYIVSQNNTFGGSIPIAGFIPEKRHFESKSFTKTNNTPFLILHGNEDEIVKPEGSQHMQNLLHNAGYSSKLIYYKGAHKIRLSAIKEIKTFISKNT
ncbi:MAG: dienelactone hydrolase family protein [Candidatus Marinimicrobia bacterium]|nr:dienelactone hydrolase family protein [Candidatus Neomarinimicrobiota bacterium]